MTFHLSKQASNYHTLLASNYHTLIELELQVRAELQGSTSSAATEVTPRSRHSVADVIETPPPFAAQVQGKRVKRRREKDKGGKNKTLCRV